MAGTICLQGGREFGSSCRDLDMEVLRRTQMGPVVVLAGAAGPGKQYANASRNAARYYANLSGDPAVPCPDPRDDVEGCLEVLDQASLVVLPGGSPSELLRVLTELDGGRVGARLRQLHGAGVTINGASAGAMVLCARTWLADGDGGVVDGLGLVPGLALPHHQPGREGRAGTPPDLPVWGLPECGGVIVDDDGVVGAGAGTPVLALHGEVEELSRDTPRPLP
jgi:hypothetical protein